MVQKIDEKARILGLSRQALIKMWIAEKLKSAAILGEIVEVVFTKQLRKIEKFFKKDV